jgi:hypothetical protein
MSDCTPPPDCPPPHRPISVALARALAEAADGFPGLKVAYFVARYISSKDSRAFHIRGPFTSWDEARELWECVWSGECGFFGPFDTTDAIVPVGVRADYVLVHLEDGTEIPFTNGVVDALFFSASAVEKFALPYYERIFGPDYAYEVMEQFRYNSAQVMAHFPWSEYTDPPKPPMEPPHPAEPGSPGEPNPPARVPLSGPVFPHPIRDGGAALLPLGAARTHSAPRRPREG